MKAKLTVKYWEEDATSWTPERKDAIQYAADINDANNLPIGVKAVYRRGNILTGESAQAAIAAGVAEEVQDLPAIGDQFLGSADGPLPEIAIEVAE